MFCSRSLAGLSSQAHELALKLIQDAHVSCLAISKTSLSLILETGFKWVQARKDAIFKKNYL